ncbi:hypothetical protein [Zoogloea sp.]|uniref:beta strand repeat-containing protein n=1 Tax=Zoogloea sp. TaxID=49181 RepID=UPI002630D481|nr:hypothetical protein [Zoogloea sp.]MDD3352822.1 hypothetical protein [Zoogloea sp.]
MPTPNASAPQDLHRLPPTAVPRLQPRRLTTALLLAGLGGLVLQPVQAASFTITDLSGTPQTLAAGQTGTITATGQLQVGGTTVALTITGNNATLNNQGNLSQTGSGRVIRDNTGVSGLMITNGSLTNSTATLQAQDADVIQMNKAQASVTLDNYGRMISHNLSAGGAQVVDFNAIASGSNIVTNHAGALIQASHADAVRPGVNGVVHNAGTIQSLGATGGSSDGIDAQQNSGIWITNSGLVEGARSGVTGGAATATAAFTQTITNLAGGVIRGNDGSGINLDGFNALQQITLTNAGLISGNGITGDGDGVDVDGLVQITNTGIIRSQNAVANPASGPAYSEGISAGGGTILNAGTIEGLVAAGNANALGRGISLVGNDIASGPLAGIREGIYAHSSIVNQAGGTIRGQNDSAIYVGGAANGFTVTLSNNAGGTIVGGGATYAAIRTGANDDTLINAGTIDGSSSGKAIDLGAGNNALYLTGGTVIGAIDGGIGGRNTLTIASGAGMAAHYASRISNFAQVNIQGGEVTLSGQSDYAGSTHIDGGHLILDGAHRLSADGELILAGGMLSLRNGGNGVAQRFARLSLSGDTLVDLGESSLGFLGLGTIDGIHTLTLRQDDTTADALRFLGDLSSNADFLNLIGDTTINGGGARYWFDGQYTRIAAATVSEPASHALMLTGLGLLGLITRRRQRR